MSEAPKTFQFRLITMNGIIVDFQSANSLEAMWTIMRGDGFFQMVNAEGHVMRRIPFHAIADLQYVDQSSMALAYAPAGSGAKN